MAAEEAYLFLLLCSLGGIADPQHDTKCPSPTSYPIFSNNLFDENMVISHQNHFEQTPDSLFILEIPQNLSMLQCKSMEITMELCYEVNETEIGGHSNVYVKRIEYGNNIDTYEVILTETHQTINNKDDLEDSCSPTENNNISICCKNLTIENQIWNIMNVTTTRIGVAFGGGVIKPLHIVNDTRIVEECPFKYDGNVHDPIDRTKCMEDSIILMRFKLQPGTNPKYDDFWDTERISVLVVLGIVAIIVLILISLLAFKIVKLKKKKVWGDDDNLNYIENAEYAEIGPRVYVNNRDIDSGIVEDKYAKFGATSIYGSEYEHIYIEPPFEEDKLYAHIEMRTNKYIPKAAISLGTQLGSGQFGEVYKGVWQSDDEELPMAIKILKEEADEGDRIKFLQEAAIMGQFKDPNVVTLYGIVTDEEPLMLVLELLPNGDLRSHLLQTRTNMEGGVTIDGHTLLSYCRQVVSGMGYLSSKGFVHRDLAARNILVSVEGMCKIADFGMARNLMYDDYYVSHGGMIPVKWTAPEALHFKKYSAASDIWSYGVVLFEIWSIGQKPFQTVENKKVMTMVDSGFRLPPPPGCPKKVYSIMIQCWHPHSSKRPSFTDVRGQLSLPDSVLLQWSEEDRCVHAEAAMLGANLLSARYLYTSLQNTYKPLHHSMNFNKTE